MSYKLLALNMISFLEAFSVNNPLEPTFFQFGIKGFSTVPFESLFCLPFRFCLQCNLVLLPLPYTFRYNLVLCSRMIFYKNIFCKNIKGEICAKDKNMLGISPAFVEHTNRKNYSSILKIEYLLVIMALIFEVAQTRPFREKAKIK